MVNASTEALLTVRGNLLRGLDRVAASIAAGTFHAVGDKGKAPPSQSGHTTLALLNLVETELAQRERLVTKLEDLFDPQLLIDMIGAGYVRTQVHPELPLTIFNYTEKAAYEGVWNAVTLTCRGLIAHSGTGEIIARPFQKFFNYGQAGAPGIDLQAKARVTDKADGSLGIIYWAGDKLAVATRGSFSSEQAIHATALLNERYPHWTPYAALTVLAEIVYPENRIVLDYGKLDDLILLGAVDIATGTTYGPEVVPDWPGPVTTVFDYATLAEALAAPARANAEGLVVHMLDSDERIKLKQDDYVVLHRIVTGLNARTVWEHIVSGEPLVDLIEPLPDEFHPWVQTIAHGIITAVDAEHVRLRRAFRDACAAMTANLACGCAAWDPADRAGRKAFATAILDHPDKWALFAQLDNKDIRAELLRRAKPEPYLTPSGRIFTEETA